MSKERQEVSISSEVFEQLRIDFNTMLERTVNALSQRKGGTADITMKLKLEMLPACVQSFDPGYTDIINGTVEAYKPDFTHKFTSVIQSKDSVEGKNSGEYALIWDSDKQEFVFKLILNDEQITLDDLEGTYESFQYASGHSYDYTADNSGVVENITFQENPVEA